MIDFSELSLEVFQVLRAYGKEIVLYDENGNRVFEPSDARRFYLPDDNILVSVLDDADNSAIKVYLSSNIQIAEILEFAIVMRRIATQFNVLFNIRKYNQIITPRDFATDAAVKEQKEYSMNIMEGLYGTSKSSYLKLENARMIVRHSTRVKENMIGGRGRSIQSIFVENAHGERFLFPVNVLAGARAMTQHVNYGGTFADEVGQQIIRMAQDFSDLSKVAGYIGTNQKELPVHADSIRESVRSSAMQLRRTFERMCRDENSYVRESARITEGEALTESKDNIAEIVEALQSVLALDGVSIDESALSTTAKYLALEDMRPDSNPADNAKDPDDGKPAQPVQPQKPVQPGQPSNGQNDQDGDDKEGEDNDEEQENGSFHESYEVATTASIRAFDEWMSEFDPENFFSEGKSYKRNDDDEEDAEEKKKQDKQKRDDKRNKRERTDESVIAESIIDEIDDDFEADPDWVYDNEDAIIDDVHACVSAARANPAMLRQYADKAQKGIRALYLAGFEPMDVLDLEDETVQAMGISESLEEGKSYKRNRDEDADDKKKQDKQRRDDQRGKNEPVEEGKSFKRNKDEDADDKKKQDKERRDSSKNKQRTDEASGTGEYEVHGVKGVKSTPFHRKFKTEAARTAWLETHEGDIDVHGFRDPEGCDTVEEDIDTVEEGKSFKRNKDEDADDKKKQDKQRRDTQRGKNEPVEEGKSFKRNDDDEEDVKDKRKKDQERRDTRKQEPVEEGKSYKRNDDDEEDADDKKKKDQEKRDAAKNKKRTDEASDISFNDAKFQLKHVKNQLAKMSPFDKNYVSTKAHLQKLEDRLARNGDDDLDEGIDDARDQIYSAGAEAAAMGMPSSENPYEMDSYESNVWESGYQEWLATQGMDPTVDAHVQGELIEDDETELYGGMPQAEFHDWIDNGNQVRFRPGTGYERPGIWNPSQLSPMHNRCWVGDQDNRGWYVSVDHLVPHHEGEDCELDDEADNDATFDEPNYGTVAMMGESADSSVLNESGVFDISKYLKSVR